MTETRTLSSKKENTMTDDIVTRLRGHIAITTRLHFAKDGYPEPVYVHGPSPICQEAADEIERLREERDEARIKLCERDAAERTKSAWSSGLSMRYLWQDIARERGWDCFKEKP